MHTAANSQPQEPSQAMKTLCGYEASTPRCINCDFWRPPKSKSQPATCGKMNFVTNKSALCDFWVDFYSKQDFQGVVHMPSKGNSLEKTNVIKVPLTREQWDARYAQQINERAGWSIADALQCAQAESDENFQDMIDDPEGCADEEMSNWEA